MPRWRFLTRRVELHGEGQLGLGVLDVAGGKRADAIVDDPAPQRPQRLIDVLLELDLLLLGALGGLAVEAVGDGQMPDRLGSGVLGAIRASVMAYR